MSRLTRLEDMGLVCRIWRVSESVFSGLRAGEVEEDRCLLTAVVGLPVVNNETKVLFLDLAEFVFVSSG
jgi:hypothetical protein